MGESNRLMANDGGGYKNVNITAWDRAHGVNTPEQKQGALDRAKKSRERKFEREREDIKRNLERIVPEFGLSTKTHRALPFDMDERDGGIAKLPNGEEIRIDETVSPYLDKPKYSVRYHGKGKFESKTYDNEQEAIAAQKRMYERHVAKIKKKYNL